MIKLCLIFLLFVFVLGCNSKLHKFECLNVGEYKGKYFGKTKIFTSGPLGGYKVTANLNDSCCFLKMVSGNPKPNEKFSNLYQTYTDTLYSHKTDVYQTIPSAIKQQLNNKDVDCIFLLRGKYSEIYLIGNNLYCDFLEVLYPNKFRIKLTKDK